MARSVLSLLVTVTTLGALVRTSLAVTCYSCSQENDLAKVLDNGTCSVVHYAEFCQDTDWCVKTWRGNSSDNMTAIEWGCQTPGDQNISQSDCITETKSDGVTLETFCWCNHDLCNSASGARAVILLTIVAACVANWII